MKMLMNGILVTAVLVISFERAKLVDLNRTHFERLAQRLISRLHGDHTISDMRVSKRIHTGARRINIAKAKFIYLNI